MHTKALHIRIYPTAKQQSMIDTTINCCRFFRKACIYSPTAANRPLGKAHPQQGASGAPYQKTGILNAACNPIGIELLWIVSSLF